jgi:formate hydrogenlyase subunit 3/multisubunit Na+/H+ antiporter MnhD subunit
MTNASLLLLPVLAPLAAGALILALMRFWKSSGAVLSLAAAAVTLGLSSLLFGKTASYSIPWAGFGMDFILKLSHFNGFILLAVSFFAFLIVLFSAGSLKGKPIAPAFFAYLMISVGFVNGAVLADHFVLLLFFWEGLLGTLFAMIALGGKNSFRTAIKAFVIIGVSDLCMMVGIALTGHSAGTLVLSGIRLPVEGLNGLAFMLLIIGALAKSGSMPFHSWIPSAAEDAPLPFMAFFPGAIEKLIGIYFLTRVSLDLFILKPGSWASLVLMITGAATILLAVMMALVQKDYKKLLSYHAISQVGYMVLGIGTALPIGIVGGLFHMLNNALYKSCLFLTAGAVEKQAGTTDLRGLGGLRSRMPVTAAAFMVCALSISGVPPFNGFFSKELIYDAALERGWIFYAAAALGSFFTAASFLKLGHAAFFGPRRREHEAVREAPWTMLIPMIAIAGVCVLFGVANPLPVHKFLVPVVGEGALEGRHVAGMPANWTLVLITLAVLAAAVINHFYGVRKTGAGIGAVDHIHHAPGLSAAYGRAEKQAFDPYNHFQAFIGILSRFLNRIDRLVDGLYETVSVFLAGAFSAGVRKTQSGNYVFYVLWSLLGVLVMVWLALR